MRNLIIKTALCGVMMVSSGNRPIPETRNVEFANNAFISDISIANTNQWVDSLLIKMYPPAQWPVDDIALHADDQPKIKPSLLKKPSPT